jgi:hypothetical protein
LYRDGEQVIATARSPLGGAIRWDFFPLTVDFASFDPDVMEGQSDCGVYFKCYVVHECSQDSGLAKGTLQKREEYESSRARACL